MPKRSTLPQSPRHIEIYDEDWEYLVANFGPGSAKRLGAGTAAKEIIHAHVVRLRNREQEARDARQSREAQENQL